MNTEQIKSIKEAQRVLLSISLGKPVFFNITQYQNMGLVRGQDVYGVDATGNRERVRTDWFLTTKGKMILDQVI